MSGSSERDHTDFDRIDIFISLSIRLDESDDEYWGIRPRKRRVLGDCA